MGAVLRKCRACGLPLEEAEEECDVCFGSPGHWCTVHRCWVDGGGCRHCAAPAAPPAAPARVRQPQGRRWCPVHRRLSSGGVCPDCVAAMDGRLPPAGVTPGVSSGAPTRAAAVAARAGGTKPAARAPAPAAKTRKHPTAGEAFLIAAMATVLLWNAIYLAAAAAWVVGWVVGSAPAAFAATRGFLLWSLTLLAVAVGSRPSMDLPAWGVFLVRLPFAALALLIVSNFAPGYWGGLLVMGAFMSLTEAFFAYTRTGAR